MSTLTVKSLRQNAKNTLAGYNFYPIKCNALPSHSLPLDLHSMTPEALINTQHLFRYYGPQCAVDDLNLTLSKGEVLGLLGPNGAGKSSTLQMLSGNLAPSAGQITIAGIDLLDAPKQAKRAIGYLPERPPVYLDLSVDEYLRYCARLHRLSATHSVRAVNEIKQRCGLADAGRRLIGNLSKGYRQRVGIAQAIIHSPSVVILDEPTVGLDPLQIREIRHLIRELAQEHSVLLSTHILTEVQAVCDRVQIINEGRTVFSQSLATLADEDQIKAWQVVFATPPKVEELLELPDIATAELLASGRLRVLGHSPASANVLVAAAVERNWGLQELSPERATLEQIFMDLVYRDQEVQK